MVLLELKNVKVELEVGEGKSLLHLNGNVMPVPREVASSLIFGEEKPIPQLPPGPTSAPKPGLAKTEAPRKKGCQTAAAKRKLSASLKRYHANKRRKENAQLKKGTATKRQLNGRSHLNGHGLHVN